MNTQIHIISEAGTNHGGSINTAKELVRASKECGADSVKFQIIYPEGLYLPDFYVNDGYQHNDVYDLRAASMLTDDEYFELSSFCNDLGINFGASVFDKQGLKLLDKINASYIKIASCDLNNTAFIVQAAERMKKIIIATGMAELKEVEHTVKEVEKTGNSDIVLMHCVSVYPVDTQNLNLNFISTLKSEFGFPVGFSDHSEKDIGALVSVGIGIEWIEKHITLDRKAKGFDHAYAMEPEMFSNYVAKIRMAQKAISMKDNKIEENELLVQSKARRGIYAGRDICQGETIKQEDILIVRPQGNLKPNDSIKIINQVSNRKIMKYEEITLDAIS